MIDDSSRRCLSALTHLTLGDNTCRVMAEKRRPLASDFIPISPMSVKKVRKSFGERAYPAVHGDRNLVERIRDLVIKDSHPDTNQDRIMDQLQNLYPEYRRKKKNLLRSSIVKALEVLDELMDDEADGEAVDNTLNESISSVYAKPEPQRKGRVSDF